jgi:hypothetical protein
MDRSGFLGGEGKTRDSGKFGVAGASTPGRLRIIGKDMVGSADPLDLATLAGLADTLCLATLTGLAFFSSKIFVSKISSTASFAFSTDIFFSYILSDNSYKMSVIPLHSGAKHR